MKQLLVPIVTMALFVGIASAQTTCNRNDFEVFEDIACAVDARNQANAEMNTAYAALTNRLGPQQKRALKRSQDQWLLFLQAEVRFIYVMEGDGSQGRLEVANEEEQQARLRAKALRNWVPQEQGQY